MEPYLNHLPTVIDWVKSQEAHILQHGQELTVNQKIDAYLIGITHIHQVRILEVENIPMPQNTTIQQLGKSIGLLSSRTIGTAYGYGIYIKKGYANSRQLIAHELVHTLQQERMGGIEAFLKQYLLECVEVGYPNGQLEIEAHTIAEEFEKDY